MKWQSYIPHFFFAFYFLVGVSIVQDFGCSWDEDQQMNHGKVSAKEICKKLNLDCPSLESKTIPALNEYEQKYYGTFFQLVAISVDSVLKRKSFKQKIHTRHYLGFILFFLGSICFYVLLKSRFNELLSLLGTTVYVCTPRIFAHSFFNPKDTVFLSFFVICLYAFSKFLRKPSNSNIFLLALSTAMMLNSRILGLSLFLIAAVSVLLFNKTYKLNIKYFGLYLIETSVCLVIIWPLLWTDSFTNLKDSFSLFSQYPWKGELLYWGNYISSFELPWHYIPSWILVTTPLVFLLFILVGIGLLFVEVFKNYKSWFIRYTTTLDSTILAATLGPLLAIIVFDSVVYGGWRHMFFLHAGFVYSIIFAIHKLSILFPSLKMPLMLSLMIGIVFSIFNLIRLHPLQNTYFNPIAGETLQKFEQDYWGVSMKMGMEKLMTIIPQNELSKVHAYDFPAWCNYKILAPDKTRLEFVWEQEKADYFIDNFRRKEHIESFLKEEGAYSKPLYVFYQQGNPIFGIFKLGN